MKISEIEWFNHKIKGAVLSKEKIGNNRIIYWGNFKKNKRKTYFISATIYRSGWGLDEIPITHKSNLKGEELKKEALKVLKEAVEKKLITEEI